MFHEIFRQRLKQNTAAFTPHSHDSIQAQSAARCNYQLRVELKVKVACAHYNNKSSKWVFQKNFEREHTRRVAQQIIFALSFSRLDFCSCSREQRASVAH